MNTMRNVQIASYINCIGLEYCEVPVVEAARLELPIVHRVCCPGYSVNAVNIFGDIYTSVWLDDRTPHTRIGHGGNKVNTYNDHKGCYEYVALNCSTVGIAVTRTCGCKGNKCGEASSSLYAILVINKCNVEVLQVDRLPLDIFLSNPKFCPAQWLAYELKWWLDYVLKRYSQFDLKKVFERRYGSSELCRVFNARFLTQVSLDDFKQAIHKELNGRYS
jgi:hypothetical protein